jgi:3-oxoacyl-[acyl-carrier-protein] synthase-3
MAIAVCKGLRLAGIATALPTQKEDNLELSQLDEEARSSLVKHTGIRFRHRVKNKQADIKPLFYKAIEQILRELNWDIQTVDALLVVTQTAFTPIPAMACQLQGEMGFSDDTLAYDLNLGCSGYVYGLHNSAQLLHSLKKSVARVLLCCGDLSSTLTEDADMTVRPIFSDAVSVTALEKDAGKADRPWYFNLQTMGKGQNAIALEHTTRGSFMRLNGIDVFNYSVKYVPDNIRSLFREAKISLDETKLLVLHQANLLINEAIRKALGVEKEKMPTTLQKFGNTASASIPLTLAHHYRPEQHDRKPLLLSGFGVGFSIGSVLLSLNSLKIIPPIYLDT